MLPIHHPAINDLRIDAEGRARDGEREGGVRGVARGRGWGLGVCMCVLVLRGWGWGVLTQLNN